MRQSPTASTPNLSNEAFVTKLYQSMGREPDSAGLDGMG